MSSRSPSASSGPVPSSLAEARVEDFVRRAGGARSEADVAAGTGVDGATVARALRSLSRRYDSVLLVGDDGRLVYDFGPRLRRIGEPTWRERGAVVAGLAWSAFAWLYKASLAIVLVGYTVVFLVVILIAAIAAAIAAEDDAPASGAFKIVGAIFQSIFEFSTALPTTYVTTDRYGYTHRHYRPRPPPLRRTRTAAPDEQTGATPEKSFMASVYDFVLGPARVEPPSGAQERECAAFVRAHGGALTVADVQALSGLPRQDAGRFFARFVAQHDGVAEITDDGVLVARFPSLVQVHNANDDERVVKFWDEYEAPFELTGNTPGRNGAIAALAAFNLVCASWFVETAGTHGTLALWLGDVPMALFWSFFVIPLLRAPWVWWKNRAQHANNVRRRVYRALFEGESERVSFIDLVRAANDHATTEERLDVDQLRALLVQTLHGVGGELDVEQGGALRISLERVRQELAARKAASVAASPSTIVHTSA